MTNDRLLKTRVDEHKAAVKYANGNVSAVAQIEFQSISILAYEYKRLILESWFIRKSSTFNREAGS